jgi:predicted transcriptional regulator
MDRAAGTVKLDDDVHEGLRRLAECSGRSLDALANEVLRDFVRYQNLVAGSIERGIADLEVGRTRTTHEVLALQEQQRLARSRQ